MRKIKEQKVRLQGSERCFNLVGGAVHGDGEKVLQGAGQVGTSFSAGREAIDVWDCEGMKSDGIQMKIQWLSLGFSLFGQNEGDGVAS